MGSRPAVEGSDATCAQVRWLLDEHANGTVATLAAAADRAGPLDRLLLAAGGTAWMQRRFATTLAMLDARLSTGRT